MTSETTGASGRRGGRDLRSELLRTSRELLDEAGPSALSMREVARRAGCTHQAPYHYFANREAILAAWCVRASMSLRTGSLWRTTGLGVRICMRS